MDLKTILGDLSSTIRADNNNSSLYPYLDSNSYPGLSPEGRMKLADMVNAIKEYLTRYNVLLRHRISLFTQDVSEELVTDVNFWNQSAQDGAVGFFAFDKRIKKLTCTELKTVPEMFCCGSTSLEEVNLLKATEIRDFAFTDATKLRVIHAPLVTKIGQEDINNRLLTRSGGNGVFSNCDLVEIDMPNLMYGKDHAFRDNKNLEEVLLLNYTGTTAYDIEYLTYGNSHVFYGCSSLKRATLPGLRILGQQFFQGCSQLEEVEFHSLEKIQNDVFLNCRNLKTVFIRKELPPIISSSNLFRNTPIADGTGFIYVPDSAVSLYKTSTNWSQYADQIKPISEYVEV